MGLYFSSKVVLELRTNEVLIIVGLVVLIVALDS